MKIIIMVLMMMMMMMMMMVIIITTTTTIGVKAIPFKTCNLSKIISSGPRFGWSQDWAVSCDGRVVKALDSKSNGIFPRRFESCSQRKLLVYHAFY